jgi:hypothetical protein
VQAFTAGYGLTIPKRQLVTWTVLSLAAASYILHAWFLPVQLHVNLVFDDFG